MAHAVDPPLANALARGMAMDSVEFTGAHLLTLPMIDGKLNSSRLEDKQLYTFMAGDRVVSVVYDRKADALVPVAGEAGGDSGDGQPGRLVSALHGAAQNFVGQFADIPQGMAISEGAVYQGVLGLFNQIEAGEKPDLSNIVGWTRGMDLFRGYLQGNRAERDALYAEVEGLARGVIGSDLYQAGQWIKDATREALPTNPEYEDEFQQKLARGGGSLAAFVVGGVAGRAVKIPATLITVTMGAHSNAAVMFQDAIANGADWEEAYREAQLGFGVGLTEAIPITRLFGRIDRGAGGSFRRALIEAAKGGTEEALQEGFQTVVNNLIQSGGVVYDPERQLFEGVGDNAGVSFTLGGLANFIAVAAGIRRRPTGPMDAPQHPTAPQRDGPGAEMAPEDVGNAPSGDALSGNMATERLENGVETVAGSEFDVDAAEAVIDDNQIADYDKTSRHESFREPDRLYAEHGQAGHNAFGLIDPESDKPIIQPINDIEQMLDMAEANLQPLTQQLKEIVADVPGVEFSGARVKGPDRLEEKLAEGRRADTLGDYLGGRIVVDDPASLGEAMRVLTARYQSVEVDNFIKEPRETGYRAIHVQVVLDNGMTAEIQIIPSEILPVYEKDHENYEKWRNKVDLTSEEAREKEADHLWARNAYNQAYTQWLQRTNRTRP
ncbi:MAG: RelA/SpoT domain-containing protein [Alphaproteobacteria bacterium]|nr:RelA/SpoT domain-containing protein [Alphaproteobacteria bacterium]